MLARRCECLVAGRKKAGHLTQTQLIHGTLVGEREGGGGGGGGGGEEWRLQGIRGRGNANAAPSSSAAEYTMEKLSEKVMRALGGECGALPPAAQDVIVSCSGGVDSCALLRCVAGARAHTRGFGLHVLHFNHGTRPESLDEERFVAALAEEVGADSFHVRRRQFGSDAAGAEGAPLADANFTQARARAWRRHESLELSRQLHGCAVVLGHHRDDDLETLLLKLVRGCHVSKLTGMAMVQGAFVRPMLEISKVSALIRPIPIPTNSPRLS